jgi:hypothetical protein
MAPNLVRSNPARYHFSMKLPFAALILACAACSPGGGPDGTGEPTGSGATPATGGSGGKSGSGAGGSSGAGTGGTGGGTGGSTTGGTGGTGGSVGGSGGVPDPPKMGVGVDVLTQCANPGVASVGPTPIRRLSRLEYQNAIRDLFSVMVNAGDLPSDEPLGVFTANVRTRMTTDNFTRYDTMARSVADQVAANFPTLSGCAAADGACNQAFLAGLARRAFHGQELGATDQPRLDTLYDSIASSDPALAANTALRWILSSPRFLYAMDFGTPEGGVSRLNPSELSGRLASFLWRSVPDAALLAAADAGTLGTADGIRAEATRMLADPKAQPVLRQFATEWLGLNPSTQGGPAVDAAIDAEAGEMMAALTQAAGTYTDLLTSTDGRGPAELASFYAGTPGANGAFTVPAERKGLLLRAAFARSHVNGSRPSPTQRGKQVREALLCEPVAFPEDNVNMQLPMDMGQPNNDLFGQHAADPECAGCHSQMDPIGFGFGNLTAAGGYDPALAPTTAGYVATSTGNLDFTDTAGLIDILATNTWPQQCFAIQSTRFALGRGETSADACALVAIWDSFKGGLGLKTLLVEIAASPLMQTRNVVNAGMKCQ